MKKFVWTFVVFGTIACWAQDTPDTAPPPSPRPNVSNALTSLAGQFFQGDFFNVYGFFEGVYDTGFQTLQSNGGSGGGFTVGGGITGSKQFSNGSISLAYRGDYRNYSLGQSGSGTDQNLNFVYSRRLGRRWTMSLSEGAGMLYYNGGYFTSPVTGGTGVQTNPFSPSTRFLQSGVYLSYRQTQRLYYTFGGSFFLTRYNYPGSIGSTGGIFSASASYILTSRTTVGGTYSHDNFYFQHSVGNSNIDGGFANISHVFGRGWRVSVSGGITRAHTSGIITLPVEFILGGQLLSGYTTQAYNNVSLVPTFDGSVTHQIGKFSLTASGGRGVNPGNGAYLTSDHTYFGAVISRALGRRAVISGNTYYSQVTSIANAISQSYTQLYSTISYSRVLTAHLSAYGTYTYNRNGSLLGYRSSSDSRFIVGISVSSKTVPFTLF